MEIVLLLILIVMFVVATKWPINIGLLGFAASFFVGYFWLGMDDKEILEEFPASIVITIIGVTFFFGLAQKNGTIDFLVNLLIKGVGGHTLVVPWLFFLVAAGLTSLGTFSPAAVALLAPAAMAFTARAGYSPVAMGALVINGAHAGGFSPISVAGNIVRQIAEDKGLPLNTLALFVASFAVNLLVSILTVVVMGWMKKLRVAPEEHVLDATTQLGVVSGSHRLSPRIIFTLVLTAVMIVAAVVFHMPIGFVGIVLGVVLSFTMLNKRDSLMSGISWNTILLVSGMIVYVSLLTHAGVIDSMANAALAIGAPLAVALVLCYVIGAGSAFASSTALITAFIPLAVPLLAQSSLSATGVLAALAISATIVDVSPMSTDGALIIASTQGRQKTTIWRNMLLYSAIIVAAAPLLAWALLVPTGYFG